MRFYFFYALCFIQVLEEIKQRDITEEVALPVFFIELVLNASLESVPNGIRSRQRASIHSTNNLLAQSSLLQELAQGIEVKKSVSFPEEPELSGGEAGGSFGVWETSYTHIRYQNQFQMFVFQCDYFIGCRI